MSHGQLVGHLLRRSLDVARNVAPHDPETRPPWEILRDELPGWAAIPVFLTILLFVIVLISVR